ncbi:MAG: hypothetical protein ACXABO_07295 [Promethearchaeota archaeon]|jgi:peroxiredoxin (alkyl hydroperoxide reductase subunit C)
MPISNKQSYTVNVDRPNLDSDIDFPIIADHRTVANKLGMVYAGKGLNTVRTVFIVDAEGIFRIILYYPQEIGL